MARRIRITAGEVSATAELNATQTAELIWEALPVDSTAQRWGQEIYFNIPVNTGTEKGQETVEMGDLGYWPPGRAFCIFFGPTPMSEGEEIRPASPVTVFGRIEGEAAVFKSVASGTAIRVTQAE